MMGAILNRYIFRETALTWFAVTGSLLLILLTDQFARVLDDAACRCEGAWLCPLGWLGVHAGAGGRYRSGVSLDRPASLPKSRLGVFFRSGGYSCDRCIITWKKGEEVYRG